VRPSYTTCKRPVLLCLLPLLALAITDVSSAEAGTPVEPARGREFLKPAEFARNALPNLGPEVSAFAAVTVDFATLASFESNDRVALNLLPEADYVGRILKVDRRTKSGYTFRGSIEGFDNAGFVASVVDDALAMAVRIPADGQFLMIRSLGIGPHLVSRIDESLLPRCAASRQSAPEDPVAAERAPRDEPDVSIPPTDGDTCSRGTCPQPQSVWDIAVFYTDDARVAAGGTNAIQSLMHLYIEEGNMSYANSQILATWRAVYVGEVAYTEGNSLDTDLDRLTEGTSGLGITHSVRSDYHADTVILVLDNASGGCGLAWCCPGEDHAYATTLWDCWGSTFVHEFGHNLGCAHNGEDVDCDGCDLRSHGWHFIGDDGTEYGTLMSYIGANFWHFSDPDIYFQGQPTGYPIVADNAATINDRRFTIENFKGTRFDIWVSFDWTGPQQWGYYIFPYNNITEGYNALITGYNPSELPVLHIKEGSTSETIVFDKPMKVEACGGPVLIGLAP